MFLCRCLQYKALRVCLFQMRFSTLGSYMIAAKDALEHKKSDSPEIPSLSGDFLMYSDRSDQYWTGFYSSRPLLKRLARLLQCCLRLLADAYFLWYMQTFIIFFHIRAIYNTKFLRELTCGWLQHSLRQSHFGFCPLISLDPKTLAKTQAVFYTVANLPDTK